MSILEVTYLVFGLPTGFLTGMMVLWIVFEQDRPFGEFVDEYLRAIYRLFGGK